VMGGRRWSIPTRDWSMIVMRDRTVVPLIATVTRPPSINAHSHAAALKVFSSFNNLLIFTVRSYHYSCSLDEVESLSLLDLFYVVHYTEP